MRDIKKALLVSFNGKSNAGGVERVVYYLDDYLHRRGIPTKIITRDFLVNHTLFGRLLPFLFRFKHFRKREIIYMSRYASAYLWWSWRPKQLVITQGESSAYYPVDIMFLHGVYHALEVALGYQTTNLSRYGKLQQRGCANARKILAVSHQAKKDAVYWYKTPEEKIEILINCVNTDIFYPTSKPATEERTLLFVGRPSQEKGFPALQQIARTIEKNTGWRFLVVLNHLSETDYFEGCTKTSVISGLNIDNIREEAYAKADLLVITSLFEGFEMVTLEALASGIPVTGTAVGGVKELTDEGFPGVSLLTGIPLDSPELIKHFDTAVDTFKHQTSPETFHQLIKERFGVEAYFKKLDELLK